MSPKLKRKNMPCPTCGSRRTVRALSAQLKHSEDGDPYLYRRHRCTNSECDTNTFPSYQCYELSDVEAVFAAREALTCITDAQKALAFLS